MFVSNHLKKSIGVGIALLATIILISPPNLSAHSTDQLTFQLSSETAFGGDSCETLGLSSEIVTVDFSVKWDGPPDTIGAISLTIEFDPEALEFVKGSFDSTIWSESSNYIIISPAAGVVKILLDGGRGVTTGFFQSIALLEFLTTCKNASSTTALQISAVLNKARMVLYPPVVDWNPIIDQRLNGSITTPATLRDPFCAVAGDANGSGSMEIGDVTFLIGRIFDSGPAPACCGAADINSDGSINISDVTYAINRIFGSGPPPDCGPSGISCN